MSSCAIDRSAGAARRRARLARADIVLAPDVAARRPRLDPRAVLARRTPLVPRGVVGAGRGARRRRRGVVIGLPKRRCGRCAWRWERGGPRRRMMMRRSRHRKHSGRGLVAGAARRRTRFEGRADAVGVLRLAARHGAVAADLSADVRAIVGGSRTSSSITVFTTFLSTLFLYRLSFFPSLVYLLPVL